MSSLLAACGSAATASTRRLVDPVRRSSRPKYGPTPTNQSSSSYPMTRLWHPVRLSTAVTMQNSENVSILLPGSMSSSSSWEFAISTCVALAASAALVLAFPSSSNGHSQVDAPGLVPRGTSGGGGTGGPKNNFNAAAPVVDNDDRPGKESSSVEATASKGRPVYDVREPTNYPHASRVVAHCDPLCFRVLHCFFLTHFVLRTYFFR
jgi:hypothetical protein